MKPKEAKFTKKQRRISTATTNKDKKNKFLDQIMERYKYQDTFKSIFNCNICIKFFNIDREFGLDCKIDNFWKIPKKENYKCILCEFKFNEFKNRKTLRQHLINMHQLRREEITEYLKYSKN